MPTKNGNSIVPTIDISMVDGSQLRALDRSCRDHGFFLLSGHGLEGLIDETLHVADQFFSLDREQKKEISRDYNNPMGWFDRELTKGQRDHKEIFDFTDPASQLGQVRNQWPDSLPGFQRVMARYHQAFSVLAEQTVALVLRALDLDAGEVTEFRGDPSISPVRLNRYLTDDPVPEKQRENLMKLGDVALGAHTDPGVLTLLIQDSVGGLQTQSATGDWVDIVPTSGAIVINIGDTMQVWTNDRYKAANHRVLPMSRTERVSIPFFLHPPRHAQIAPIPALAHGKPHYRQFAWLDYIKGRDDDNFQTDGEADIQIADFRL